MDYEQSEIKATIHRVVLVTEDKINSFPFFDPDNPDAGNAFLSDCQKEGWPSLIIDHNVYVFATSGRPQ